MPSGDANLLARLLACGQPWDQAHRHSELDSTQAALRLGFATHPPSDLSWRLQVASHQTAGRGRNQATWHAAADQALLMSAGGPLLLAPELWPRLSLVAGLAVRGVLARYSLAPLQLKWPNDIVVRTDTGWHKLGGLLCERVGGPCADPLWLCGVGVNLAGVPEETQLAMPAIDLAQLSGRPIARDDIAVAVAEAIFTAVQACVHSRGQLPIALLEQHLAFVGSAVALDLGPRDGRKWLHLQGLDSGGELRGRWVLPDGSLGAHTSVSPLHLAAAPAAGWPGPATPALSELP